MARAWLTPDEPTSGTVDIVLTVPVDLDLLAALTGAVLLLLDPENWEQYGSMTPEQAAAAFSGTLDSLIAHVEV